MATIVLVGVGVAPANATSGTGYDGTDPASTGCASNSTVIYSQNLYIGGTSAYVGAMEIRYSAACQTNWVRVYNASSSATVSNKYVERRAQGSLTYFAQNVPDTYIGWSYGVQVYAPGSTCIWVQGGLSNSAWTANSSYFQIC